MKRALLLIVLALLHCFNTYALHSNTRNGSSVKYRNQYQRIIAPWGSSFELRNGKIYDWGGNDVGDLGTGNTQPYYSAVQMGTDSNWVSITASSSGHTLAIKSDGSLWAWGYNNHGQLGIGTTMPQLSPVQVGADHDWIKISAGEYSTIGIKADGTLWVWGENTYGQLGLGDTVQRNVPTQVGSEQNWVSIAVGANCTWALKADGTLWAWGWNREGELGSGDTLERHVPTQVGNSNRWVQLPTLDANYFAGVQSDGSIWGFGYNYDYDLGLGDTLNRWVPTQTGTGHDWVWVANGGNTMAVKANGTLWGWGENGNSGSCMGLGGPVPLYVHNPIQVNTSNDWVTAAASGKTIAMKCGGNLWATGLNVQGQLGLGYANFQGTDTFQATGTPAREWISGAVGGTHSAAVYSDGTLWTWGYNNKGQLGLGNTTEKHQPTKVGTDTAWVAVMAGSSYTLGMKSDGSIWAWGDNTEGQLGTGNNTEQHSPVQISGTWASVAAGDVHSVALKADGTLWAWGNNSYGQLGLGNYTAQNAPIQVGTDNEWIAIATGEGHTLGLKSDGTLWAWGENLYGQLGTGNNTIQNAPVQVGTDNNWTAITAGANHSMALKADGTLWAWGQNTNGQLGLGNNSNQNSPQQVSGNNWIGLNAASQHSIAYKADGTIWSWGNNDYGQLGLGNNTGYNSPQQVTEPGIVHIFTGPEANQTGIIKDTRSLICLAGKNDHGQLGDSSIINKNTFECLNECVQPGISIAASPNDTVCSGDTTTFTATVSNAGPTPGYQWFKNNSPVGANSATYTVTPGGLNTGDVIKCVLTGSAACNVTPTDTSNIITMQVTQSVTPTITIAADMGDTICQEHLSTYTATITNGGPTPIYQWYENGNPVGTNSNTYVPLQISGDIITCKLTSSAVCPSPHEVTSAPHTMLIAPVVYPTVTITANPGNTITQNQSVTFTATVSNATNPQYQWKKNGSNIAGATSQTYTATTLQNNDVITCRVRGLTLCDTANSSPITMVVWATGVAQVTGNSEQIMVWPNPAKEDLVIGLTPALSKGEGDVFSLSICDVTGRELISSDWDGTGEKHIDIKQLASGVYMLKVMCKYGNVEMCKWTRKVVKE